MLFPDQQQDPKHIRTRTLTPSELPRVLTTTSKEQDSIKVEISTEKKVTAFNNEHTKLLDQHDEDHHDEDEEKSWQEKIIFHIKYIY
jgi:hypothetical protein